MVLCSGSPIPFIKQIYLFVTGFLSCLDILSRLFAIPSFFGEKRPQLLASAGCSARGLFAPLAGDVQPSSLYSFLKLSELVKGVKGWYGVRSKEGQMWSRRGRGYIFADFGGIRPPRCSQKGVLYCPLFVFGPVGVNTVPETTKEWCMC